MTDDATPPPSSCVHNLHRDPDVRGAPEPTTLCRNAVGVFHMLDCPLFLGRTCTYYEACPGERETTGDLELEQVGEELRRDFLGWHYARRVRALAEPAGSLPELLTVEAIDEPEENLEIVLLRPPAGEEGEAEAVEPIVVDPGADEEDAPETAEAEAATPAAPRRPETYPGQRRSEERGRGGKRPAPRPEPAADEDAAAVEEPVEDDRPKTVDDLFDTLPEAHLPDKPEGQKRAGSRRGRRGRGRSGRPRSGGSGGGGGRKSGEPAKSSDGKPAGGGRRRRGRRGGGSSSGQKGERPAKSGAGGGGQDGAPKGDGSKASGEGGRSQGARGSGRRRRRRGPRREGGGGGGGGESGSGA